VTPVYVTGVGLWATGFASAAAFAAGAADPAVTAARAELFPGTLRRRATFLSCMVAAAAAEAAAEAGARLSELPFLLASAYGEIATSVEMMRSFGEPEGLPSPTRFHNSVHNTPAAYVSIATGNRGFSTALSAGAETVGAALGEAVALLHEDATQVLVAFADEPTPPPFDRCRPPYAAAAAALVLAAAPGARPLARLTALRRGEGGPAPLAPPFADHPCAGALALVRAVRAGHLGTVALGPAGPRGFLADLDRRPGTGAGP
jgi:hypothetical protein